MFGLVEFLAYRPLYCLEFYAMYKYARITAVTLEVKVVNRSSTSPLIFAIGTAPYSEIATLSPDRFWEKSTTQRKQLSVLGGLDKGVLRKTFVAQDIMGQPYLDQKYWIDVTQSASTSPVDVNEPVLAYCLSDFTGTTGAVAYVNWKITYHIQFFDLKTPSSSLSTEPHNDSFRKTAREVRPLSRDSPPYQDDFEEMTDGKQPNSGVLFGLGKHLK